LVNLLVNDLLRIPSTIATAIALQQGVHLFLGDGDFVVRHEPTKTLGASGCGQAALVGVVVLETTSFLDRQIHIEANIFDDSAAIRAGNHGDAHETGRRSADVDQDANNRSWVAGSVNMNKVQLALRAASGDEMLRREVHVPPTEVDSLAVELQSGQGCEAVGGVECVGWSEAPVE
jgi:hypothetical protein